MFRNIVRRVRFPTHRQFSTKGKYVVVGNTMSVTDKFLQAKKSCD